ncbi:TraR/DksA family transcriptional regulator [Roseovarius faecimaris]|uniref:TraR/DksA family transcriptional regulator n=1 Tax=Roseovarius faecimaris TaxID=2494550 RepID=A0A6I6IT15_9RHOB|nr:TraR/DksA C4-type zinc finger protein [Roseovarius faecimaris]QGY00381.1 TraR/DksA family transcriptional regulator [Roseovarius faecimaris]
MNESELARFRALITTRLAALDAEDSLGEAGQATVELDQQAVGRLSRMDALQNQAMAQANAARRKVERTRLHAALARMEEGEFGYCDDCGDEIAKGRLELDPAAQLCIDCATG